MNKQKKKLIKIIIISVKEILLKMHRLVVMKLMIHLLIKVELLTKQRIILIQKTIGNIKF